MSNQGSLTGREALKMIDAMHEQERAQVMTGAQAIHAAEVMRLQAAATVALPRPVEEDAKAEDMEDLIIKVKATTKYLRYEQQSRWYAANYLRAGEMEKALEILDADHSDLYSVGALLASSKLDKERAFRAGFLAGTSYGMDEVEFGRKGMSPDENAAWAEFQAAPAVEPTTDGGAA
jgi:hypothetical protein